MENIVRLGRKKEGDALEIQKKILGECGPYSFVYSIVLQSFGNIFFHSTFQLEAWKES
jgi:hypothetical protein